MQWRLGLLILTAALAGGCTFVRIEDGSGVRRHAHLGPVADPAAPGLTVSRTEVLGLGWAGGGLVLGWAREHAVRGRGVDDCRVVIFRLPTDPVEARQWRELIAARPDICVATDEKTSGEQGDVTQ